MGRTKRERVWHSRPLLEVVPRDQPFVYHSPDHLVLQSPLPVQHPPSLEQLLLQLLRGRKMLNQSGAVHCDPGPRTRRHWPIESISGEGKGLRDAWETGSGSHTVTVRGRLIFPPGAPIAALRNQLSVQRFSSAQGPCAPHPSALR